MCQQPIDHEHAEGHGHEHPAQHPELQHGLVGGRVHELGQKSQKKQGQLGVEGVEYHVTFWKSELIDFVILQQDAFDEIDAVTPMERQEAIVNMVIDICHTEFEFDNFNEVMDYFKKMINVCKQMNYSKFKSPEYDDFVKQLNELIQERKA